MKKGLILTVVIVAVVLAAGGSYLWFHDSSTSPTSASSKSTITNTVIVTRSSSSLGDYLAEPDGRALYTFSKDISGVSNCTGSCILSWPAYQVKGTATNLPANISTIKRSDNGETQYTYNGMPLYTFVGDVGTHVTGDGVSGFSVAKPSSSKTAGASADSTNSSSSSW